MKNAKIGRKNTKFAAMLGHGTEVILPLSFELGRPEGTESAEPGAAIAASSFSLIDNPREMASYPPLKVRKMTAPLPGLSVASSRVRPYRRRA